MGRIKKRNIIKIFLFAMLATYGYLYCDFSEIYKFSTTYFSKFYTKIKDIPTIPFRRFGNRQRAQKRAKIFKHSTYAIFELYNYFKKGNNSSPIEVDLSDLMT